MMNSVFPLVSILVPIYRVEKYIERCTRSLFEQTYPNLEFIFVDDASPDKSVEFLQQVLKLYPKWELNTRIIYHEKNRGLAAARNTLVDNCKGEFLVHVDSDDWIEPNAIELLVKKQLETDADMVTGLFYRHTLYEGNEIITKEVSPLKGKNRKETLKTMLEYGSVVATWNRLIRRSLYHQHNIRCIEGIDAGEDVLITPRLVYYSQKVATCNAFTYHYNQCNSNSYVNSLPNNWDMQHQLIQATLLNVDFFKDKETFLYEAMDKQLAIRLKKMLELTYKKHNRHGYNIVLAFLDDMDQNYLTLIGWDKSGKKWLDHHYYLKRLSFPLRRIRGIIFQKFLNHELVRVD